jgi:hypothetical protein
LRASLRKIWPASVSRVILLVRSISVVPISSSSRWIVAVSGGWAMFSRSAARRKLSSSATAMNCLNCRSSIIHVKSGDGP